MSLLLTLHNHVIGFLFAQFILEIMRGYLQYTGKKYKCWKIIWNILCNLPNP